MSNMIDKLWEDQVEQAMEQAMDSMFPYGAGKTTHQRVSHHLEQVAKVAFCTGKTYALMGLMTAEDVAEHFQITPRRARALIKNRHERFAIGMKAGNTWLVHRDDLDSLTPEEKYRSDARDD